MLRVLKIMAMILLSVGASGFVLCARAGFIPESMGLVESVEKADVIALVEITMVIPDPPTAEQWRLRASTQPITDYRDVALLTALQPPSTYFVRVVRAIKGSLPQNEHVHLPVISGLFYYDDAHFTLRPGAHCLLLLKADGQGVWTPVDNTVPLIPLGREVETAGIDWQEPKQAVLDLMLATLADHDLRHANVYLLRRTHSAKVLSTLKEYVADVDRRVRVNVLLCMAFNQDVTAIPLIAAYEKETGESAAAGGLDDYQTPSAVPLLNQVIVDAPYASRLNALLALRRRLANRSSIPYLVKSMLIDNSGQVDSEHMVGFQAYRTLHDLLGPVAGPAVDCHEFVSHRETEVRKLANCVAAHPSDSSAEK